ncbi:MAG TPA: hypothetical protein VMX12_12685 [Acidimicrobiia bacterium]|nr:hypothetical protein [Acidimicrobiia bacterium]
MKNLSAAQVAAIAAALAAGAKVADLALEFGVSAFAILAVQKEAA